MDHLPAHSASLPAVLTITCPRDFAPAELLADDLDRFESPSPTFGRAEEPSQPKSGYDSSPGEDSGGDFGATRTPEIYIHQSVIDADDREEDDAENSGLAEATSAG